MSVSESAVLQTSVQTQRFGQGKRLVFFVNDLGFFVSHRLILAQAAIKCGFEVHLIGPDEPLKHKLEQSGVVFHPISWGKWYRLPWQEVVTLYQLFGLIHAIRPDLMHNVTIRPTIFGSLISILCGTKAVINALPGLGYIFLRDSVWGKLQRRIVTALYATIFRAAKATVIVQNQDDLNFFTNALGLKSDRVVIIKGSGVDLQTFCPAKARRPDPEMVRILFPARLLVSKGIIEYLQAAQKILAGAVAGSKIEFIVAGDPIPGNPGSIAPTALSAFRANAGIRFEGYRQDMHRLMQEVDIVCLPSYGEGLPKALLEAAACGLPIVTCNVPGCREIVRDGLNGFLVPSKDVESLSRALATLIADSEMRQRFGKFGRQMVEESFSQELVIEQTMQLYKRLLGGVERRATKPI